MEGTDESKQENVQEEAGNQETRSEFLIDSFEDFIVSQELALKPWLKIWVKICSEKDEMETRYFQERYQGSSGGGGSSSTTREQILVREMGVLQGVDVADGELLKKSLKELKELAEGCYHDGEILKNLLKDEINVFTEGERNLLQETYVKSKVYATGLEHVLSLFHDKNNAALLQVNGQTWRKKLQMACESFHEMMNKIDGMIAFKRKAVRFSSEPILERLFLDACSQGTTTAVSRLKELVERCGRVLKRLLEDESKKEDEKHSLQETYEEWKLYETGVKHLSNICAAEQEAQRRKSDDEGRTKDDQQKVERLSNPCSITKIIKPIGYSASISNDVQDVCVTFVAISSDGREVVVDNKQLKADNPQLLIRFYEQHLRYSPPA